jgi:hypothetical protein
MARPNIEPVTEQTLPEFAEFLYANLSKDRNPQEWQVALRSNWGDEQRPNFGFVMREEGRIVGGIGTIYATRRISGREERFCNITSWCVLDAYRKQSMRLAMAVVEQPGYNFTDFSPTEVVGGVLRFLKFKPIDDRYTVILNLPLPFAAGRVISEPSGIAAALTGDALQTYRDHTGFPWLRHVLVGDGSSWCHVIYKPRSFKGLPSADLIHVSDEAVFSRHIRRLTAHFLMQGMVSTHVETRHLKCNIQPSRIRSGFNPRLYLSAHLQEADIDYLYSETVAMNL